MVIKTKDVAAIFHVNPQTVRNWTNQTEVREFFSPEARRDTGALQAEFFAEDIDVCNSIYNMLRQKSTWHTIAENLRSGWRDDSWPERAAYLKPPPATPNNIEMATSLAVTKEQNQDLLVTLRQKDEQIQARDKRIAELLLEIDKVRNEKHMIELDKERIIIKLQTEVSFWREGKLKYDPPTTPTA